MKGMKLMKKTLSALLTAAMVSSTVAVPAYANGNSLDGLEINNGDYNITGNLCLPESYNGKEITWTSDNSEVINTEKTPITGDALQYAAYAEQEYIPAGVVTRGAEDTEVCITAQCEGEEKTFNLTVKGKPEEKEYTHYLYADFHEPLVDAYHQQVFYAVSDDGLHWKDLNYGKPVVKSVMGTQGLRDHFILRSAEGDKFYLICTDLEIMQFDGNWGHHGGEGSEYLMIWESDDLINWGEQRMVKVSDIDEIGCSWAPECIYDDVTGEYVLYYSGSDKVGIEGTTTDGTAYSNYDRKVVYYVTTRDFYNFSEPKRFTDIGQYQSSSELGVNDWGNKWGTIDTTMIKANDWYYRVTKNEYTGGVTMDKSKFVRGDYMLVDTNLNDKNTDGSLVFGGEGPAIFKFNPQDSGDTEKWCLMIDSFGGAGAVGWFPSITEDLNKDGNEVRFERLANSEGEYDKYQMPTGPKHGVMMPITDEEYNALVEAYGISSKYDVVYSDTAELINTEAVLKNGAEQTDEGMKTNGGYIAVDIPTDTKGEPLSEFTVSFDVLNNKTTGKYYNITIGDERESYEGEGFAGARISDEGAYLKSVNKAWNPSSDTTPNADHDGEDFEASVIESQLGGNYGNVWEHVDYVVKGDEYSLYVNGRYKDTDYAWTAAEQDATKIRFGFDPGNFKYKTNEKNRHYKEMSYESTDALYKNIKVYDEALSQIGISNKYNEEYPPEPQTEKLISLSFDEKDTSTEYGKAVDNGGVEYETGYVGKAAAFDGTSKYIALYNKQGDSLFTEDQQAFSVSFWSKTDPDSSPNWLFYTSGSQYASDRQYIGLLDNGGRITLERGKSEDTNDGYYVGADFERGKWKYVTLVVKEKEASLYINGEKKATQSYKTSLSDILGENSIAYINKADWASGEYGTGLYDEYRVYSRALTDEEVLGLYNAYGEPADNNAEYGASNKLLLAMNFDNSDMTAQAGKAEPNGTITYKDGHSGKAAYFDNNADNYIKLFKKDGSPLLKGLDKFTVSYWSKTELNAPNWMFYAAPNDSQITFGKETYFGIYDTGSYVKAERFLNGRPEGALPESTYTSEQWNYITVVAGTEDTTVYVNGEKKSTVKSDYAIKDIIGSETSAAYIGRANWGAGESCKGLIDDVRIYNYAVSQSDIKKLYNGESIKADSNIETGTDNPTDEKSGNDKTWSFENGSLLKNLRGITTVGKVSVTEDPTKSGNHVMYINGKSDNGQTDYAVIPYKYLYESAEGGYKLCDNFTVEFDLYDMASGWRYAFNAGNEYGSDGKVQTANALYFIPYNSDGIQRLEQQGKSTSDSNKKISLDKWTHIKIQKSGSNVCVYINDEKTNEITYTEHIFATPEVQMGFSPWGDVGLEAYIDNLRIVSDAPTVETPAEPEMLLWYNFRNGVSDASGNGNDGINNGVKIENNKAVFSGDGGYISMPNGLLKKADSATVSVTFKNETENGTYKWLWGFGNDTNNNFYFDPCVPWNPGIAAIKLNGEAEQQIVYESGFGKSDEFVTVTVVANGSDSRIYKNGKLVGKKAITVKPSDLGDTTLNYIGKSFYSGDVAFKGEVTDFKVYNYALTDNGIIYDMALAEGSDEASAEYIKNWAMPASVDHVIKDIELKTANVGDDGFNLSWKSSNTDIIGNDGKLVSRPDSGNVQATLTMKLEFNGKTYEYDIPVTVSGKDQSDYKLNITDKKGVDIQDTMWGLFFEDISRAADGGLYAEEVYNRSFENLRANSGFGSDAFSEEPGYAWSSSNGTMNYKTDEPINENNRHYLEFTGTSFENDGYDGFYVTKDMTYNLSFYAKSDSYKGGVTVTVKDKDGAVCAEAKVTESISGEWTKYTATMKATKTAANASFTVSLDSEGTVDFDMISMIPGDAVNGIFRKDLAEMLKAMNPGFLRFPGGCIVEGYNTTNAYKWKNTVGAVEERIEQENRWATDCHDNKFGRYNQSFGIGYYEYMLLCEYLECEPVPVLPVGIGCEYQSGDLVPMYTDDTKTEYTAEFKALLDDAVDLIDFANSIDFENNKWAALRRDMGHEKPFNLTMIGIGNEQWETETINFYERYAAFEEYVHAKYPQIKLLGTSGPGPEGNQFEEAWEFFRAGTPTNGAADFSYAVDEHYYNTPTWFLENVGRYDNYDRKVKVFAGEYASREGDDANTLHTTLTEAAYMTGLERNADVVYMCSYAPLFAREGWTNWGPNMIWFDGDEAYGSPDYYEQKMYSVNKGDYTLENKLESLDSEELYYSAAYEEETGDVIIKLVNISECEKNVEMSFDGFEINGMAKAEILTNDDLYAKNSIDNPENCVTVKADAVITDGGNYPMPANSFVVLRVPTRTAKNLLTISDGSYSVNTDGLDNADIYVAEYNRDGVLLNVEKFDCRETVSGTITSKETTTVGVFVWEKNTMTPICSDKKQL